MYCDIGVPPTVLTIKLQRNKKGDCDGHLHPILLIPSYNAISYIKGHNLAEENVLHTYVHINLTQLGVHTL